MKKFSLLIGILFLTLVTVGCQTGDKYDLYVFNFKAEVKDELKALVNEYGEANDLNVKIMTVGGGQDTAQAMRAEMSKQDKPTIFNIGGPQDLVDWEGYLADLSDMTITQNTQQAYLAPVSQGGNVYGVPMAIEGYGFVYNTEILSQAGIDPKGITSFADLKAAVEAIDAKKDELGIDAVFSYPTKETWVTGLHSSNIPLAFEFYNEGIAGIGDAETIDFSYAPEFKKLIDLQAQYTVEGAIARENNQQGIAPGLNNVTYTDQVQALAQGKVAMIQQGNWIYPDLEQYSEEAGNEVAANVGIIPMFLDHDNFPNTIPIGVPSYWAVNAKVSEDKQQTSKDFLDWMYTEKGDFVVEEMKFISPYTTIEKLPEDPLAQDVLKYSNLDVAPLPWVFTAYPPTWGMDEFGVRIQDYVAGNKSWNETITESKAEWKNLSR
ncbi:ABC transporter substrate-binding protein [Haloplasma contractile]|uniref:ABC-type transporter periplasmic component protein n=1 Tax=Haloplasma contractile SSD-17B TaxID=1033810 RepID=U2FQQ6_9MOLU|nr:ABC transporter substrate-binding protein [Haloplasma contractile]ERJ13359.1 ABC-type transporter periplasmic component protein [Haloplasma contractile SSD-17B]